MRDDGMTDIAYQKGCLLLDLMEQTLYLALLPQMGAVVVVGKTLTQIVRDWLVDLVEVGQKILEHRPVG